MNIAMDDRNFKKIQISLNPIRIRCIVILNQVVDVPLLNQS